MRNKIRGKSLGLFLFASAIAGLLMHYRDHWQTTTGVSDSFCLTDNIITVREGGRLGNCVWEYYTVLGLQEILTLTPFVPRSIQKCLGAVFKNLTIPAYEDTLLSEHCRITHGGDVKKCESKSLSQNSSSKWDRLCYTLKHGDSIGRGIALKTITEIGELKDSGHLPSTLILPKWIAHTHVFAQFGRSRFKQEWQFRDDVQKLAVETLNGVRKKTGNNDLIFVGVHVRRTDYIKYVKHRYGKEVPFSDLDYYKRAMSRMHDLYNHSRMVFVVVSDDYIWCKENLVNEEDGVYWGGLKNSGFINNWKGNRGLAVGHDLAVLALQNHSIIGYGTYAFTGSLLSGGHIIAFNMSRNGRATEYLTLIVCKTLSDCELL